MTVQPSSSLRRRVFGGFASALMLAGMLITPATALAGPGTPPDPNDDVVITFEDVPKTGNVLSNDNNPGIGTLTVVGYDTLSPTIGTMVIAANGDYTFTPAANWNGSTTMDYDVANAAHTRSATIFITVIGFQDNPVANNDTIAVNEDTATNVTAAILANDTDGDGNTLTVSAVSSPSGGTVTRSPAGVVTFTPTANLCGNGAGGFNYQVSDGTGRFDTAHATVNITCVNDGPVAIDDTASGTEDLALVIAGSTLVANDTDIDGGALSVSAVSSATGGSVSLNAGVVTFTPTANLCGSNVAGFDYTVSDGNGGTDTGHVTISLACQNDSPNAVADTRSGTEDQPVTFPASGLAGNDTDTEGNTLTVTGVHDATGGTVSLDAGTVTFTPDADACGTGAGSFQYDISDGNGGTATGSVSIDLTCTNDEPVAGDDSVGATEDTPADLTAALLDDDTDVDGDTLSISDVDNVSGGTVDLTAGVLTFTPDANACGDGAGSFDYQVSDGNGGTDWAHATVDVTCVNDDPQASGDAASGTEDNDVVVDPADLVANDTDVEGDSLSVDSVGNPSGGTVVLDGGSITFTPDANLCGDGAASFDYTVVDGNGGSHTGTVTIDLACENDAPSAVNDDVSGTEDTAVVIDAADLVANDSDVDGDTLTVTDVGSASDGTVALDGTTITFTPDADLCGDNVAAFAYQVSDGNGGTDNAWVFIDLACENDNPVAQDDSTVVMEEVPTDLSSDLLDNDSDVDGDAISISDYANVTGGTVDLTDGALTFTADTDLCGDATAGFDYQVSDGNGGSDWAHATLDVTCDNDVPVANDDTVGATEDTPAAIAEGDLTGNDTDVDGDTLSVDEVGNATGGSVELDGGVITFTPDANLCGDGAGSFDYAMTDGQGGHDTASVTVDVECVDDAPIASDDTASGTEDTNVVIDAADLLANDSDVENDTLTVTDAGNASGGSVSLDGTELTFTPDADLCGDNVASFDYEVSDGNGGVDTGTVTISLACANDAPVANDDTQSGTEDQDVVIDAADLVANDTDVDGDTLAVDEVGNAAGGSVSLDEGEVTFTPDANLCGDAVAWFEYVVVDGNGKSDVGTVTIDLACENDGPSATDDSTDGTEDTDLVIDAANLLLNDNDIDGPLTVSGVSNPTGGTVSLDGTDVTFTPTANLCGDDAASFDYTVDDGDGGTDTATVTIDLTCTNDAPVANDDTASVAHNSGPAAHSVLANDTDIDGDTLTVSSPSVLASAGTVSTNGTTVTYTPASTFSGHALITYTVSDGNGGTDTATLDVTVDVGVSIDVQPPHVTKPVISLGGGRVDTDAAVIVTWKATDAQSGVKKIEIQSRVGTRPWTTIYKGTKSTVSLVVPFRKGLTFRVRATDNLGNMSGWIGSSMRKVVPVQNLTTSVIKYKGGWTFVANRASSGGGYSYTTKLGASATYTFTGSQIAYVAPKMVNGGYAKIYIDGVFKARVNLKGNKTAVGLVIARFSVAAGTHTVKIVNDQAGKRTTLDAFLVLR